MRYFVHVNDQGFVTGSLASERVPGEGPGLPANCIEVQEESQRLLVSGVPGYRYLAGEWIAPTVKPVLDTRSFFLLFTQEEILELSAQRQLDHEVEYFWTMFTLSNMVDLGHPFVAASLKVLVQKGLLTQVRADQIAAGACPT